MTRTDLYAFLKLHKLGVLSTLSRERVPQSALVGIAVTADLEIVFDTLKSTRKYPNLTANPICSFVVGWSAEQTLQYEGKARELASPELEWYQKPYFEAWPDGPVRLSWPAIVYFAVRPSWIRYSDFARDPPLIREFVFDDE